jgi:hypothetical protein
MKQLLLLLCCLEVLFATFLVNTLGPYLSPVVFVSLSLGIGFVYLRISSAPALAVTVLRPGRIISIVHWALFLGLSFYVISQLKHYWWYHLSYGDTKSSSDVIPQITTLVQRFLQGEQPYYTIQFPEYTLFPTYLPFQWMPYIICEWLHKDYRWVPTLALWIVSCYHFINSRKAATSVFLQLFVPIWPLLVWLVFILHDWKVFVFTVEGLIAGYYFFVAAGLSRKRPWLFVPAIALCLLSRYSIVFWVPLCLLLLFVAGYRRQAIATGVTILACFVLFYWMPFLRKDPQIFMKGYAYHTNAAYGEWLRDLNTFGGKVYLLNGLGFTSYALKWLPGDEGHILMLYKNIHLAVCAITVLLLGGYFIRYRTRYDVNTFLLFSFKVYLAVFYAFIQIPYKYLMIVPIMVSAALLGSVFRGHTVKER